MTTIVRVKRRLEDNPQDALVITCKKIKTDADVSPSLYVFRGTVENQETTHLKGLVPRCDIKQQAIVNVKDIVEKLRKEQKKVSIRSRYEVVNFSRGLKDDDTEENDLFDLVDLQKSEDIDGEVLYAYDLYTAAKQDSDVSTLDTFMDIETDLVFSAHNNGRDTPSGDEVDDEDDSNDENNWRNDYPDSEASSIQVEDMITAMERVDLDDLSSDEGEDKIYDDQSNEHEKNANLYGTAYAKYKARVLSENPDLAEQRSLIHSTRMKDLDEESIGGYKSDSDDGFYYGQDDDNQSRDHYSDSSDAYSPD